MNETIVYNVLGNIDRLQRYNKYGHRSQMWFAEHVTNGHDYNPNRNAIIDERTGFHFDYNVVNLPQQVRSTNNQELISGYTYDATGNKLAKNNNGNIRNYVDGIEYNGSVIDII
ncbi:hypothetical protein, partial [Pseudomonas viridiflava]|uniref:hypothetical protein n=1 Tax=Pseudomonas viridiflava TaxID=33069 RepID=UPI0019801F98